MTSETKLSIRISKLDWCWTGVHGSMIKCCRFLLRCRSKTLLPAADLTQYNCCHQLLRCRPSCCYHDHSLVCSVCHNNK
ncbi:hypothetical protein V6Z11_D03G060600 [Gossypium hirsutum]